MADCWQVMPVVVVQDGSSSPAQLNGDDAANQTALSAEFKILQGESPESFNRAFWGAVGIGWARLTVL